MIGLLKGNVVEKNPPVVLLDVSGVGYEINAPMSVFFQLPLNQEEVQFYTHLIIREDAHTLYGFLDRSDQMWFRSLIKVNGVGPRMALAILSSMEPRVFAASICHQEVALLVKIPGVGKKTAERLVIELKEKCAAWLQETQPNDATVAATDRLSLEGGAMLPDVEQDAQSALVALGFKPTEAAKSIRAVRQEGMTSEALIKAALKERVTA